MSVRVASGLIVLLGIWLFISPFVLEYAPGQARANDGDATSDLMFAVPLVVLAGWRVLGSRSSAWIDGLNAAIGAYVFVSAFALSNPSPTGNAVSPPYFTAARADFWDNVAVGALIVAVAGVAMLLVAHAEQSPREERQPTPEAARLPVQWASALTVLAGVWLLIAPWSLGVNDGPKGPRRQGVRA